METRAREQKPTGIVTPLSPRISSFFISSETFTSWKRFPTFILRELPSPCTPVSSAAASASSGSLSGRAPRDPALPAAPSGSRERRQGLPLVHGAFQKGWRSGEGQQDPSLQPGLPPTHSLRQPAGLSAALTPHARHVTSRHIASRPIPGRLLPCRPHSREGAARRARNPELGGGQAGVRPQSCVPRLCSLDMGANAVTFGDPLRNKLQLSTYGGGTGPSGSTRFIASTKAQSPGTAEPGLPAGPWPTRFSGGTPPSTLP